jgi:branched-chain amino acid transport system permease protein/neutral amino acid transport system permease protein
MVVSAYAAYALNHHGVTMWISALAGIAAGALLSVILNNVIYTPFQRRGTSPIGMVIVSLGMTLILVFGTQALAGPTNVSYSVSPGATVKAGSIVLTALQLVIIALSIVVMVAVHVLIRYTRLGKAMRATSANRNLARNCGIRTDRVVTITWLITGALCGLAGVVFALDSGTFGATSTDLFLVLILAAVFLGGPGEPYGAMLGALVIGLATEVSASIIVSDYKTVVAFVILIAMLAFRPSGLLGAQT